MRKDVKWIVIAISGVSIFLVDWLFRRFGRPAFSLLRCILQFSFRNLVFFRMHLIRNLLHGSPCCTNKIGDRSTKGRHFDTTVDAELQLFVLAVHKQGTNAGFRNWWELQVSTKVVRKVRRGVAIVRHRLGSVSNGLSGVLWKVGLDFVHGARTVFWFDAHRLVRLFQSGLEAIAYFHDSSGPSKSSCRQKQNGCPQRTHLLHLVVFP
mmetsp:Transcript_12206/g.30865  ORF Transcript_12206/g.30865 Transcript_12206/m.30865 type:complete len:208 (-) Transcript_12206:1161-1784(-)